MAGGGAGRGDFYLCPLNRWTRPHPRRFAPPDAATAYDLAFTKAVALQEGRKLSYPAFLVALDVRVPSLGPGRGLYQPCEGAGRAWTTTLRAAGPSWC